MTNAEAKLWSALRDGGLGAKFRRQLPIGPYIADFACIAARLVVEIDGGQHAGSSHDAKRDAFLRARGWRVLRFWNHEALGNLEGVLEAIRSALDTGNGTPPNYGD